MKIKELIEELSKYDNSLEALICDGHGSVDPILQVNLCKVDDCDRIVSGENIDNVVDAIVLGWNI